MSAPVSRPMPPRDAECARCGHAGAEHQHAGTGCWATGERERRADGTLGPVRLCDCPEFVPVGEAADGITRRLAPTQVLGEVPDGEHYAAVHHTYRIPHDLPDTGGVS
jgi:hypothetical protein